MHSLTIPVHRPVPVEILEAKIREACGSFDLEPMGRGGMISGDLSTRRIAQFEAVIVSLDARQVQRGSRAIRRDPGEYFFLLVQEEGHCRVDQCRQSIHLAPGDMFLVDSTRPSAFVFDGEHASQMSVHMPRDEMLHRFGEVCAGGVAISRCDPLWLAMRAVLSKMMIDSAASSSLAEAFYGLIGAYLQGLQSSNSHRRSETLLSRALAVIERHGADPSFGPHELAERLNVSDRMLQRHFNSLGETPGRRILNHRLNIAHARLSTGGSVRVGEGIAVVAFDAGFNDLSYFYREFRKKYGMTPGSAVGSAGMIENRR